MPPNPPRLSFSFLALLAREEGKIDLPYATTAFIILNLLTVVVHVIMILTALFSKTVNRQTTWINFCLAWIFYSIGYSLVAINGQIHDPNPQFGVCLTQASLVYSVPSMCSISMLALLIEAWMGVRTVLGRPVYEGKLFKIWLIIAPYIVFVVLFMISLSLGIHSPDLVVRGKDRLYCGFSILGPANASGSLVACFLVAATFLEGVVVYEIRKHWAVFRARKGSLSGIIRIISFTLFGIVAMGMSFAFIITEKNVPELQVLMVLGPIGSVLIFGSGADMFRAWMFWRRASPAVIQDDSSAKSLEYSA